MAEIGNIARSFGLALSNVLCLSGVERIAIGGGVAKMGDVLIEPIRHAVHEFEFVSNVGNYEISPVSWGMRSCWSALFCGPGRGIKGNKFFSQWVVVVLADNNKIRVKY